MNAFYKMLFASLIFAPTMLAYAADTSTAPSSPPPTTSNTTSTTTGTSTTTPSTATTGTDYSGTYNCNVTDPVSNPPTFKENIVFKKNGNIYNVQVIHPDNVLPYLLGTGIVNKDIDNAISYVYWNPSDTTSIGTEFFKVNSDGSLTGVYSDHNKSKSGIENCTKAS